MGDSMRRSFAIVALGSMLAAPVVAQDKEPDKQRIAEIMAHVEARADSEATEFYNEGDYPKAIQNQLAASSGQRRRIAALASPAAAWSRAWAAACSHS